MCHSSAQITFAKFKVVKSGHLHQKKETLFMVVEFYLTDEVSSSSSPDMLSKIASEAARCSKIYNSVEGCQLFFVIFFCRKINVL